MRKIKFELGLKGCFFISCCMALLLVSCGTSRKASVSSKDKTIVEWEDLLSFEQRRKFDYYFLEAIRLKEKGELDAAFDMYSHCLEIDSQSAAVQYEMAQFYMFLGQTQKGENLLRKAVSLEPDNYWYKQTLASHYRKRGENEQAVEVIEDIVERFPSRLEPLMELVDLYARLEDYKKVIHTLDRLEKLDGKSEQISMEKFRMYLQVGDMEKAFTEIESLVAEYPYEMRYLNILGDAYLENGRSEEAYPIFRKVLNEEPGYAPAMLSLASYYEKTGQDSLYRAQLDTVLLNRNVENEMKVNIMRQLIVRSERGDKDSTEIVGLFDAILEQEQPNADVAMLAAQYLLSKKMDDKATSVLHKIVEIDPENKPAYLQLLSFAISKNDLDEVVRICTPAIEYMPEALEFYYYKGLAHYQKDQNDEALKVFEKGVRQVNEESDKALVSDFYAIMGDIFHSKKMDAEAYAAYDSALVYKEDNIGVLNNYAYYLSVERRNLDKAEEMSYRTVKAEPKNDTYLDTYAWILFEKGKYAEARIYIDQALQHGGAESSVVVEHCGDIYFHCGETEKAVEYWKQAEEVSKKEVDDKNYARSEQELKLLRKKISNKKYYSK
jgi:tetratricopeptide (TPR) repeat protein